jgi:hypothetical protein
MIFCRVIRQVPLFYSVLLLFSAIACSIVLLKIEVPVTWVSLLAVACTHIYLCSQIQYRQGKKWLLKQYTYLLFCSYAVDFLLIAIPFFLLNPFLGIGACTTGVLCAVCRSLSAPRSKTSIVIPSPFFVKSAFLWHSQMRYLFPCTWIFIAALIIIGYVNENPNLAFVAFGGGVFLACLSAIFQSEKSDFIQIYVSEQRFIKQTLIETILNSILFMLPLMIIMLFLFSEKWLITLLAGITVLLLNINMLWIKYAFYPSMQLAFVLFLTSLVLLGALASTLHGLILVPVYYAFVFHFYKKNIRKIIANNERAGC